MAADLTQVLADLRADLDVLERNRAPMTTDRVREFVKAVEAATVEWRERLTDGEAALRSGLKLPALRALHARLMPHDAWIVGEGRKARRLYRACCVPRRLGLAEAFAAGQRAAESA